ncbi:hypothetical protein PLANPX_0207 [Lacipirellula parvula]|uniref:Uncharacterized protein n=1 Tax=Lacipirellula parvula TaxID=2650471 RepID=A0A5K7X2N8_9BACT|nr:hypothetical protein PLANPX_0207 [Lacipirellula parvula]
MENAEWGMGAENANFPHSAFPIRHCFSPRSGGSLSRGCLRRYNGFPFFA